MVSFPSLSEDFPILQRQVHGKSLVYLDNAATSQKPRSVIQAITNYYEQHNANVHRGVHQLGDESTQAWHDSRRTIASFLGADPAELITVRNTTEALNQVAYSWGDNHVQAGDVILTTQMEHHSNLVPWQELAKRQQASLEFMPVNAQGRLDLERAKQLLFGAVKIVALTHVSNTLGTLNPLSAVVKLVRQLAPQAVIVVDGAQAAAHLPVNFHQLDVDFYAVSAHKMLGPMGMGGLLVKKALLPQISPWLFGGGMIDEVTEQTATFIEDTEELFSAGTPDVAGLVGWAAACEYLSKVGMKNAWQHDQELVKYTLEKLTQITAVKIIGPQQTPPPASVAELEARGGQLDWLDRVGSVAFVYQGVHAHDVGQVLDSEGVAVRSGHHCTMPLHQKFEWVATTRVSFQLYNTQTDVDRFLLGLAKVKQVFGK